MPYDNKAYNMQLPIVIKTVIIQHKTYYILHITIVVKNIDVRIKNIKKHVLYPIIKT